MENLEAGRKITESDRLIRRLSLRQWLVAIAVTVVTLGSMGLGWHDLMMDGQSAELINLAGRQRMLSQRIAMHLVIPQAQPDKSAQQRYRNMAAAALTEFEKAHQQLTEAARKSGKDSALYSRYFGPGGRADSESLRFQSLVREALDSAKEGRLIDSRNTAEILSAASDSLIRELEVATTLHQQIAEQNDSFMLRLHQISTLLMIGLIAFGMFGVLKPIMRRLSDDVAARDRAQRDLKESEERFRAFSESASDWYWETDAQHRFSWVQGSQAVPAPLSGEVSRGKTRQELRAKVEESAVEKWLAYQEDLDARRPFRDFEYQVGSDDQAPIWVSVSGKPYFAADGEFLGYRGTAKYIQEKKDTEAALLRLQLAIEQSPASITVIDSRSRIIYANAYFSILTGYSAQEALGCVPKVLLWSGQTPETVYTDMYQTLAKGKIWRGEVCGRSKRGTLFWENLSVSPVLDELGKASHFVSVSEDITEQKRVRSREINRNQILEAIAQGTPLPKPLELMVAMAEAELDGGICTLQRLDKSQGKLFTICHSTLSLDFSEATDGLAIDAKVGAGGTAVLTASRFIIEDIASHPHCQSLRALAVAERLRACWAQPIISSTGQVLGTLNIYYRNALGPSTEEIHIVELVASLAAICLERDETEQQLRRQEEHTNTLLAQHKTILNTAPVGIVYLKQRRVVSCNHRLEEIFGYESGELIGESSRLFYDTDMTFDVVGKQAYAALADGRNFRTEMMLKHKDGSLFRGALNGCAVDSAHPQDGSIWIYADISERYRNQQEVHKLLQAVEQSPASIIITNHEGLIEYVNPRFCRVTGYRVEEVIGRNPRILQSGQTPPETYKELWQTLLACGEWRGILHNRRKNGEVFWEEASISPIIDDMGQVTHYLAVKEDITERKRTEDELEQHRTHLEDLVAQRTADLSAALDAARVADQAKDAFLANVSHELRTPLNAVIGLSELARQISKDPKQQDYLDKVTSAGKSLAGLINDLLDLSKIAAGHLEFESTSFSLERLVQRCRSVIAHRAAEKGLKLVEKIGADVPDVLRGDPLRIEQILLNLLSNAVKFTATGHVELRIALSTRDDSRVFLKIEVEDTGIGLSEESLALLFKPFAQADSSINRKFGGTGLGLALTKRLAEMMGGTVSVSSREGAGTTFSVNIWLGLGDAADLAADEQSRKDEKLPSRYQRANVLLVEDQPLNREIVEALLSEVGITPHIAVHGGEALEMLRKSGAQAYDLVLMDIQMPVMDGVSATREIRRWEGFEHLPIVAMTAHTMAHEKEVSLAAGMNDHIGKPFETANFFRLLARWIAPTKKLMAAETVTESGMRQNPVGLAALPGIDTQAGLARFSGNEERYRHWLRKFLTEAPGYVAQIREPLAAGRVDDAFAAAHSIKGGLGTLGMIELHEIAIALEDAVRHGAPSDELLAQMQTSIDLMCAEIHAGLGVTD